MDDPGQKLKRARERLGLRYRDVEEFSQQIADRRKNSEFSILLSRLSDIENRGVVPSIFKLYSLCAIYRLDLAEVVRWYGVEVSQLVTDAAALSPEKSHLIGLGREKFGSMQSGDIQVPLSLDPGLDLSKTTFLTRFIQSWGVLPLMLVAGLDLKGHRYAYVGTDDWFMYPMLLPGSLLLLDESRKKIAAGPWAGMVDRPVYFLEHRDGWMCGWCSLVEDTLIVQPHPASGCAPVVFQYPSEVDVIGQVTGVANRLDAGPPRRTRS
ncbi:helix-turn-helix domain-containing protein [Paludibaculum fermentans]|uniref:Helix-turn-helix transcriptional regulator n=1 Tax=Paludibaculum fermentans TaxID=1473598 RepID=A0A7S7NYQ3_PALFE|nr:helix-turn-helix transcriptional regulator [Paludibaculum fermentans]QOY91664.1 helix-turn-helix transcriptional regulator [Paludibaculum fermentans]